MARFEGRYLSGKPSDRRYDCSGAAELFRCLFESGVMALGDNLRVEAAGAQTVQIHPGKALLDGYLVKVIAEGEDPYLVQAPQGGKRGRVVLRAEKSGPGLYVKEGTAQAAPELERTAEVYEMSLASIWEAEGLVIVVDERADEELCGVCELQSARAASIIALAVDSAHPVGEILMREDTVNPSSLYGGTWQLIWQGKTPVGVDPVDADFNAAGKTGGTKAVRYSLGNSGYAKFGGFMTSPPRLRATVIRDLPSFATDTYIDVGDGAAIGPEGTTFTRGVALGGTTEEGSNMPPYITCYFWKRVA